jgi:hypothetical protein
MNAPHHTSSGAGSRQTSLAAPQTAATSSTSRPDGIPAGIEGLFEVMLAFYGDKFAMQWSAASLPAMRAVWRDQLRGLSAAEISRGVTACRSLRWPPTLPEFLMLCRPALDPETAFYEAAAQMALRERGKPDAWSHAAVYWAACEMGGDVTRLPYPALKSRWTRALEAAWATVAAGTCEPVPPQPLAIAGDHNATPCPPAALARLQRVVSSLADRMTRQPGARHADDAV